MLVCVISMFETSREDERARARARAQAHTPHETRECPVETTHTVVTSQYARARAGHKSSQGPLRALALV